MSTPKKLKRTTLHLKLTPELHRATKVCAAFDGVSMADWVSAKLLDATREHREAMAVIAQVTVEAEVEE